MCRQAGLHKLLTTVLVCAHAYYHICTETCRDGESIKLKIYFLCTISQDGVIFTVTHIELIRWAYHNITSTIISILNCTGIPSSCSHAAVALNIYRYMQQTPTLHSHLSAPTSNSTLNVSKIQAGIQRKIFKKDKKKERKKCVFLSSSPLFPLRRSSNGVTVCISMQCFCF